MPRELPDTNEYSPFTKLLGLSFTKYDPGHSQVIIEVTEKVCNSYHSMHGGAIYTMADIGMGAALYCSLDEDELCKTIEITITYFKPVTEGVVTCESKVISQNRKLATLESEITNNGRIIAKAIGTFYILKAEPGYRD